MKRFVIAIFILIGAFSICLYSNYIVTVTRDEVVNHVWSITEQMVRGDREKTRAKTDDLCAYWELQSHKLIHYVRHKEIDDISKSISRIQVLLTFDSHAEFMAELSSIQWHVSHIWESELLTWDSIL